MDGMGKQSCCGGEEGAREEDPGDVHCHRQGIHGMFGIATTIVGACMFQGVLPLLLY